jgi:hypothetical protein
LQWVDSILSVVNPELKSEAAKELLGAMTDGVVQVLATYGKKIKEL